MIKRWRNNRSGATSIEYCLIAGVVSIAILSGATSIGKKLLNSYFEPVNAGTR